jgi:hypothetical protein
VGWLSPDHEFPRAVPCEALLDRLWEFCQISVQQTRGIHDCPFCEPPRTIKVTRNGRGLLLGTAEIRAFSPASGHIYAAPTLIYHYVAAHHYAPPAEFVHALMEGPSPSRLSYFGLLSRLEIEWGATLSTDNDGYAIHPNVLGDAECDSLIATLDALPGRAIRAGRRHLMALPEIAAMANDPRMTALAKRGVPFRATYFDKSPQSNWLVPWHQDTALPIASIDDESGWGPWSVKEGIRYAHAPAWALRQVTALRLSLDDSGEDNGPLRVISHSHELGVLSDDEVAEQAQCRSHDTCLVPRGGVLAMSPLIIHASGKATSDRPRRVLHIEYAPSLDLGCVRLAMA